MNLSWNANRCIIFFFSYGCFKSQRCCGALAAVASQEEQGLKLWAPRGQSLVGWAAGAALGNIPSTSEQGWRLHPNTPSAAARCWIKEHKLDRAVTLFFWFFSGCQELHKPLNYVRTGGRTKVPWTCLSLLPCCLLCTQELCEPQSLWVTAGVCGHTDENIHVPKYKKTPQFSALYFSKQDCCVALVEVQGCRNFAEGRMSSFGRPHPPLWIKLDILSGIQRLDGKRVNVSRLEIELIRNSYNF